MPPTLSAPPRARTSRSCENCRVLKRRCDKQVPRCGQCIRTREACLGYRDEWDLVFRDQTSHTVKRSRKRTPEKKNGMILTKEAILATPPFTPRESLLPNLEEIGVNYFLWDFVVGGHCPWRGYLNYIPTTAYSGDAEHPTVITSMAAVGLVALATHQPELVIHARAKYSEAIRLVNDALASPVESVKDSTLMSVISLGVFEHVSNFESWVRHVKGAAALVVSRGKSQFASSRSAILLFNQVRADLSIVCIQSVLAFPDDMRELQEEATKYMDHFDAFRLLGVLATRCATLFAGVAEKHNCVSLSMSTSWTDFLEESIALQDEFQCALDILAVQEPYMTIQESGGTGCISYNGWYDLYKTSWAIRLWNNARVIEMIVCEIICWLIDKILAEELAYSSQNRPKLESKLQYAMQIMSRRADEILASVPQGLGFVSWPDGTEERPQLEPNVSGGYMMIWSLYTVGKSPVVAYQNRKWIIDLLKGIHKSANIAMALELAEDLVKMGGK